VYALQVALAKDQSLFTATPNGYFGRQTEAAVKRFQLKYGVVKSAQDAGFGTFGKKTQAKFIQVFGNN
jgi:peptidoglycan hydrolase-like protein with peptidoglycan-binding domain